MTKEQLQQVREALGMGDDLTEENAIPHLLSKLDETADLALDAQENMNLSRCNHDHDGPTLDPDVADQLAEGVEAKLDSLVSAGNITPVVSKNLRILLAGEGDDRPAMFLSKTATGGDESLAKTLLGILSDNDPVILGEKSGSQLQFALDLRNGDSPLVRDAEARAEAAKE
jgi:hypothetical protein